MPVLRLSLDEAADRLGVSVRTVRRRVRAGELPSEREPTAQGFRYVVLLEVDEGVDKGAPSEPTKSDATTSADTTAGLRELLTEVTGERDWLRERVEDLMRQHEAFQVLLRERDERIRRLESAQTATRESESGVSSTTRAAGHAASQPSAPRVDKRPWWRRLFGGG